MNIIGVRRKGSFFIFRRHFEIFAMFKKLLLLAIYNVLLISQSFAIIWPITEILSK